MVLQKLRPKTLTTSESRKTKTPGYLENFLKHLYDQWWYHSVIQFDTDTTASFSLKTAESFYICLMT